MEKTKADLDQIQKEIKPYLVIKVKRFLAGGELKYEIKVKGKSIHTHKPKDSASWVDRLEEWDALMND